jgi:hypothetical protein
LPSVLQCGGNIASPLPNPSVAPPLNDNPFVGSFRSPKISWLTG